MQCHTPLHEIASHPPPLLRPKGVSCDLLNTTAYSVDVDTKSQGYFCKQDHEFTERYELFIARYFLSSSYLLPHEKLCYG